MATTFEETTRSANFLGTRSDLQLDVETPLSKARELKRWWSQTHNADAYQNRYPLVRAFHQSESSFGFADTTRIDGNEFHVIGEVEDLYFDSPKDGNVERFRNGIREFVLRYLLRVSDFQRPSTFVPNDSNSNRLLRPISLCPEDDESRAGFGYQNVSFKRPAGSVERFPQNDRFRIPDVRTIGSEYEWILLCVRIFDFAFRFSPFGSNAVTALLPLDETSFIVLHPDFLIDRTGPETLPTGERVIGQYGFGYAFIPNPQVGLLGYGPGEFDVAFQQIHFRVYEDGTTRVQLAFAANSLRQVLRVPIVPIAPGLRFAERLLPNSAKPWLNRLDRWSSNLIPTVDPVRTFVNAVNLATAGWAARQLCVSQERLEQIFLVRHFGQHYGMIVGSLRTWREIPDWTDRASLPEWVESGVSS